MKIRMVQPGFAGNFTGVFGRIEFIDGVSVGDVGEGEARFLACITSIEWVDTGEDPGDNAKYQVSLHKEAVSVNYPTLEDEMKAAAEAATKSDGGDSPPIVIDTAAYTKEQLEQIADKEGIAGLRKVADPLNVKGVSVAKLIHAILTAQFSVVNDAESATED